MIRKTFGKSHKVAKTFNKNNIKVSYNCMDNMAEIKVRAWKSSKRLYNSQNPIDYPLDGKFVSLIIVCSAEMKTNDQQSPKVYLGITEMEVKTSYNNDLKLSRI